MTTVLYWKDNENLKTLWSEFEQYKESLAKYGAGPLPMVKWGLGVPMGYFVYLKYHHTMRTHFNSYTSMRSIHYPHTWTVGEDKWYVRSLIYEEGFRLYVNLSSEKDQQLPDFHPQPLSIADEYCNVGDKAFPALWLPAVHLVAYKEVTNGFTIVQHKATLPDDVRCWAPPDWVRERNVYLEKVTFGFDFGTARPYIQLWHKVVSKRRDDSLQLCTLLTSQAYDKMNRAMNVMNFSFGKLAIKKNLVRRYLRSRPTRTPCIFLMGIGYLQWKYPRKCQLMLIDFLHVLLNSDIVLYI